MGVCEMKTFESDSRSIIGLEPAKQAVEKHSSDLLAVCKRNVDLKRFSPAEIAGVARRLLVMELKQSVFSVPHEDLEQSFSNTRVGRNGRTSIHDLVRTSVHRN